MHLVKFSDFASLADLASFKAAKKKGWSDKRAFGVGDNGIGCWGDNTAQDKVPMCALPPEDIKARFGSEKKGRGSKVKVTVNNVTITCELRDIMPHKPYRKNGCDLDLNPAALRLFSLRSPTTGTATWEWVD